MRTQGGCETVSRALLVLVASMVFSATCGPGQRRPSPYESPVPGVPENLLASPAPNPMTVSLRQLIARPSDYDGRAVRVIGFARLEFEGHGLFFHREDDEQYWATNAIWVDVELRPEFTALNGRYVIVEGVFEAKNMGHSGAFRGPSTR